jgi:hypothetical protein
MSFNHPQAPLSREETPKLYVHYMTSEDRSGTHDEQISRILVPLAQRSQGFDSRVFEAGLQKDAHSEQASRILGPLAERPESTFDPKVFGR